MPCFEYNDKVKLYYEEHGDPSGKQTVAFLNGVMASANSLSLIHI